MTQKDIKEIYKYRELFPSTLRIEVQKCEDGFIADIKTFKGCSTQGDSLSDLIEMVNDVVRTYFEIPEKYLPFMPTYSPPILLAKKLDVFPTKIKKLELEIKDGKKVAC
jgi:predicted RNase H-like HicB family nuclease